MKIWLHYDFRSGHYFGDQLRILSQETFLDKLLQWKVTFCSTLLKYTWKQMIKLNYKGLTFKTSRDLYLFTSETGLQLTSQNVLRKITKTLLEELKGKQKKMGNFFRSKSVVICWRSQPASQVGRRLFVCLSVSQPVCLYVCRRRSYDGMPNKHARTHART